MSCIMHVVSVLHYFFFIPYKFKHVYIPTMNYEGQEGHVISNGFSKLM